MRPAGRSLFPKEHGAYAQLALPLLVALFGGRASGSAALLAGASMALFVAHEPLLVLLGRRGVRARESDGARARRWLVTLAALAVVSGIAALVGAPRAAPAVAFPLITAAVLARLVAANEEKTALGELVAATALSSAALPVAIAAGWSWTAAFAGWATWVLSFTAATLGIRSVIAARKRGTRLSTRLFQVAIAPTVGATAAFASILPWTTLVAAAPTFAASAIFAVAPPHPRALMRVGWTMAAAALATSAVMIYFARA